MSVLRNPLNAYREVSVRTATQGKLIVMLYDEAVKQLDSAIGLLSVQTKQLDKVHNALIKTQDIITELMTGLDFDRGGEIARNLMSLYVFFNEKIREGNMKKDVEPLKLVRAFVADLRSAWVQIANSRVDEMPRPQVGVNIAG
ncbi:MAG: flagellar export chaperone FliS [Spirochaetales bacterium]